MITRRRIIKSVLILAILGLGYAFTRATTPIQDYPTQTRTQSATINAQPTEAVAADSE